MHAPHVHLAAPSPWIQRWSHLISSGASVLDVACGSGRHLHWFAERGCQVTGVDRDIENAQHLLPNARLVQADIENGPWPLVNTTDSEPELFDAVVVTNYLWRPLMVTLLASLAPGGVLLFETFAAGNETVGRPVRPDFCYKTANCCTCAANCTLLPLRTVFWSNPTASCSASPLYVSLPPVHTMPLCRVMHSS